MGVLEKNVKIALAASDADSNDFLNVPALTTKTVTFEIQNTGSETAKSLSVSESSDHFSIESINCATSLSPQEKCEIRVSFTSPGNGAFVGTIDIAYRDAQKISHIKSQLLNATGVAQEVEVSALYAAKGAKWNDYVKNDGTDVFNASGRACIGSESGNYFTACIHGGEKRLVSLPLSSSCSGLEITEELGAFEWQCHETGGGVVLRSKGLKKGKYLSHLLSANSWKDNRISVRKSGLLIYQSNLTHWWANSIETALSTTLSTGRIYVISENINRSASINMAEKSAIVVMPGFKLNFTSTSDKAFITTTGKKFFWIEGNFLSVDKNFAVEMGAKSFLGRIENATFSNFTTYLNCITAGADHSGKHYINEVKIANRVPIGGYGIRSMGSVDDLLVTNTKIVGTQGCIQDSLSQRSTYSNIHCAGNDYATGAIPAVFLGGSNTIFSQMYFTNTGTRAFSPPYGSTADTYVTILGATSARNHKTENAQAGMMLSNLRKSTAVHIVGVDMAYALINDSRGENQFSQMAVDSTRSFSELMSNAATTDQYLNYVLAGTHFGFDYDWNTPAACNIDGAVTATPLPLDENCQPTGSSAFTLISDVYLGNSFVGELTSNDASNTSDTGSPVAYSLTMDILNYENFYRSWGKSNGQWGNRNHPVSGISNPHSNNTFGFFACDGGTGKTCSLWDWRLKESDTVLRNKSGNGLTDNEPFISGEICPTAVHGNKTTTDLSGRTFLTNAIELIGDGVGNDNSLCESNESCFYMPNIGAYQGEGDLLEACEFQDATVSNVTMHAYAINGAN